MELAFTIIAGFGIFFFLLGYFGFVFAGFKHHFVTGLISALPVLNIVTVPALWRIAKRKVFISLFGLIIVFASWFLGANTGIQKYTSMLKGDKQTTQVILKKPQTETNVVYSPTVNNQINTSTTRPYYKNDESNMLLLPKKALYQLSFESVPIDKLQGLLNKVVKVTTTNNRQIEGRITTISTMNVVINGKELPIANINKVSMMVRKSSL